MKVYVVTGDWVEGSEILAVFATSEAAKAAYPGDWQRSHWDPSVETNYELPDIDFGCIVDHLVLHECDVS